MLSVKAREVIMTWDASVQEGLREGNCNINGKF